MLASCEQHFEAAILWVPNKWLAASWRKRMPNTNKSVYFLHPHCQITTRMKQQQQQQQHLPISITSPLIDLNCAKFSRSKLEMWTLSASDDQSNATCGASSSFCLRANLHNLSSINLKADILFIFRLFLDPSKSDVIEANWKTRVECIVIQVANC